ncbi:MAG: PrpF domain-containing protein [Nitratireductor sp.]
MSNRAATDMGKTESNSTGVAAENVPAKLSCTIMRGGTSKAVFLRDADLPVDVDDREQAILAIFGSPDRRQVDGLGGADPLTSKLAIIAPAGGFPDADTDVIYTFGQVGIQDANVDWHSLCGNITSAVGLYAIQDKLAEITAPLTRVCVYNTNLKRKLWVEVPVDGNGPVQVGDYAIPGVPGTGPKIMIDFLATAGAATGNLLPTGNAVDTLDVAGVGRIEATLLDIGNAHVFVRASDVGLKGTESAAEIDADEALRSRLEAIRAAGAVRMGMLEDAGQSVAQTPATPILVMVSPPAGYASGTTGENVQADDMDLVARAMFMQQMHKTYPGTSTVCTGVAARVPGTLPYRVTREETREAASVRIGHPAGVIETETRISIENGAVEVRRATLGRTARRLIDGQVYLPPMK